MSGFKIIPATGTILDRIAADRKKRVDEAKASVAEATLRVHCEKLEPARDVVGRLRDWLGDKRAIIAEVKRRSPSKGDLAPGLDAGKLAASYERAGALAISCLVEPDHFGGSLEDLRAVRAAATIPVLYKDFVVDPYQLWEARANGADMVLLIVALLGENAGNYLKAAHDIGLTCLVEVHEGPELEIALATGARLIGVNNRNLKTMEVDLANSEKMLPRFPAGVFGVGESGIKTPGDMDRLADAGARAFLIGESLVTASDPETELKTFVEKSL